MSPRALCIWRAGAMAVGVGAWVALSGSGAQAQESTSTPAYPTAVETPAPEDTPPGATETEILASEGATFAAKDRIAVFLGNVRVHDPRFTLACDKLTVFLAKEALEKAGGAAPGTAPAATPAPTPTPLPTPKEKKEKGAPKAEGEERNGGGIDHAVAEGHVIIIQKRAPTRPGEEEKISIGRSETCEFDNKTGDLTLRGWPKVEQNGNSHEALTHGTVMVLHRDNSLDTRGPSRTKLIQRAKESPSPKPATSPVASR